MVVLLHGSFKDKVRRCIQTGSFPAMAAASMCLSPGQADAALVFRPDLSQVIDLGPGAPDSINVLFDIDNDSLFEGLFTFFRHDGFDPLVFERIVFDGPFHIILGQSILLTEDMIVTYQPGDLVELQGLGTVVGATDIALSDFETGGFVGMTTASNHIGYLKVEFDSVAQTVSLTNFAYESNAFTAPLVLIQGDLNGDGFVGIADLNIALGNWNQDVTPGDLLLGDPTGDGFVGIADLNTILGNWNSGIPSPAVGASIPEPSALSVLALGAAGVLARRRADRAVV